MKRVSLPCAVVCLLGVWFGGGERAEAKKAEPPVVVMAKKLVTAQIAAIQDPGTELPKDVYAAGALFTGPRSDDAKLSAEDLHSALVARGMGYVSKKKISDLKVVAAADGEAAWVTFGLHVELDLENDMGSDRADYRVSEVVVHTGDEYWIAGGDWSVGIADKEANQLAMAGTLPTLEDPAGNADEALRERFAEIIDAPAEADLDFVSNRADVLIIGTAPKEKATGKAFKKSWKASAGHANIEGGVRAGMAASGTVGWVTANIRIAKPAKKKGGSAYFMYYRVFSVYEHVEDYWLLVHAHFSVHGE